MKQYTIPVFVPELACPNKCVFCNQHSISGCHKQPSIEDVELIIKERLSSFQRKDVHIEIGFFGGNFTGIDQSLQIEYLSIAKKYLDKGDIQAIRLSTRPDYITNQSLAVLKDYQVSTIELGAQSLHDDILLKAGRGHTVNDIRKASQLIREAGFKLGLQMMTGLPCDTPEKSIETAKLIIELGADFTRIYPTLVIKHTDLEKEWLSGRYKPQTLDKAVSLTADLLELFESNGVEVIRVGLHPSEDLIAGKDLLAGPFHVSFRQLAETELWKRKILKAINHIDSQDTANNSCVAISGKTITVLSSKDQLKSAIGYSGSNREMLLKLFSEVNFVTAEQSETNQPLIIADKRLPLPAKNALHKLGKLKLIEASYNVYKSISGHPDIFMCSGGSTVIVAPSFSSDIIDDLKKMGYTVLHGNSDPGLRYPETAIYNAVITERYLIHNMKITEDTIKNTFRDRKLIHVSQGYTRCNLLPLNEDHFITSDHGIERALLDENLSVLYVDPQHVVLKGQKHGFFPGCCGVYNNKVVINGSLSFHPHKSEITDYIKSVGMSCIELFTGKLTDTGSLFFFSGISN